MKAKRKEVTIKNRKPWERLTEVEKKRIVREVNSGLLGQRAAARKYGLSRNSVSAWIEDYSSFAIKPHDVIEEADGDMNESTKTRILAKQVENLTKQLAKANLKISSLQTLIEISEQELHIKIRKKSGTKQLKK